MRQISHAATRPSTHPLNGYDATRQAQQFGDWLAAQRPPIARWDEPRPPVDAVAAAVRQTPSLVVIGHDGPLNDRHSLRAHSHGSVWLDGSELGMKFPGARIYAWACWTLGYESVRDPNTAYLGDEAVASGAQAVAGHSIALPANLGAMVGGSAHFFREPVKAMIFGFLEGEDDAAALRERAQEHFPEELLLDVVDGQLDYFRAQQQLSDIIQHFHVSR
jgi:hypothetical protein